MATTFLNETLKMVYIGDETKGEFGKKAAFSVFFEDHEKTHVERLFNIPLINTSIADFALSLQLYIAVGFLEQTSRKRGTLQQCCAQHNFCP